MTRKTELLIEQLIRKEFYQIYEFYISDIESCKKHPEIYNKRFRDTCKEECNEIITAYTELKGMIFEEAEKELINAYTRKKARDEERRTKAYEQEK